MKWVKLGDVCNIQSGGTPSRKNREYYGGSIPWVKISDITASNGIIFETEEYLTESGLKNIRNRIFQKGTLLFSMYGTLGETAVAGTALSTNQAILGINPKTGVELDLSYLKFWFKQKQKDLGSLSRGVALKNLSATIVRNFKIPLPSLSEQRAIVERLDRAQRLIDIDREMLHRYDALIQSVFLEMFGDPVRNPKGWVVRKLGDVGVLERGKSKHRPRNDTSILGGEYPLIQTGDVSNAGMYIKSFNSTYNEKGLKQSKMWQKGTLCITIAANIAKVGILNFDACFPDSIVGFKSEKTSSIYIHTWFGFFQKIIEDQAPVSAQKNINLRILRNLEIIFPPHELQKKYELIVFKIDEEIKRVQYESTKSEEVFSSLVQGAFRYG
jgi:type I restriction enzyme S subunit